MIFKHGGRTWREFEIEAVKSSIAGVSRNELRSDFGSSLSSSNVTKIRGKAVREGYLEREGDRSITQYELTSKGSELLADYRASVRDGKVDPEHLDAGLNGSESSYYGLASRLQNGELETDL